MIAEAHATPLQSQQRILKTRQRAAELLHLLAADLAAVAGIKDPLAKALIEELRFHFFLGLHVINALF